VGTSLPAAEDLPISTFEAHSGGIGRRDEARKMFVDALILRTSGNRFDGILLGNFPRQAALACAPMMSRRSRGGWSWRALS
jgi:hypothetical protein